MNKNRNLRDRIRGWFPQEPALTKSSQRLAQVPLANRDLTSPPSRTTRLRREIRVFPLLIVLSLVIFAVTLLRVPGNMVELGVIVGLVAGSLISVPFTKTELKWLSQNGKIRSLYASLPLLSFCILFAVAFVVLNSFFSRETAGFYFDAGWAAFIGAYFSNLEECFLWENRSNKRIYKGLWGDLYTVTQANRTTVTAVNHNSGRNR